MSLMYLGNFCALFCINWQRKRITGNPLDRIRRRARAIPRDNVSQRLLSRAGKRRHNFDSLMETRCIGPRGVRRQVHVSNVLLSSPRIYGNTIGGTNSSPFSSPGSSRYASRLGESKNHTEPGNKPGFVSYIHITGCLIEL
ncbi:hypothetical protein ANTPLA_LOCUS1108 [Anthophora plagiata]